MQFWTQRLLAIVAVLVIAGCGTDEEDGSGESGGGEEEETASEDVSSIGSLQLIADERTLDSGGEDDATLLAVARDENNVVVPDAEVVFSTEDEGSAIEVTRSTTNAQGSAEALLSSQFSPENRSLEVEASIDGTDISDSVSVVIEGTDIGISGPANLTTGGSDGDYVIEVRDSEGNAVPQTDVSVESSNDNAVNLIDEQTDESGKAEFTLSADSNGTDLVTVAAAGAEGTQEVRVSSDDFTFTAPGEDEQLVINTAHDVEVEWLEDGTPQNGEDVQFTTTRGEFGNNDTVEDATTDGDGQASVTVESANAGVATIEADADGVGASREIRFISDDPDTIAAQAVPSSIAPNEAGSEENRSEITATVRDSEGNLVTGEKVQFSSSGGLGSFSSANVETDEFGRATSDFIAGEVQTEFEGVTVTVKVADDTSISEEAKLTIADSSYITVGSGGSIEELDETRYRVPHTLFVANSDSSPAANLEVSLELQTTEVIVGDSWTYLEGWLAPVSTTDCTVGPDTDELYSSATIVPSGDTDSGENSGSVQVITDDQGYADFDVIYPRSLGSWSRVEVLASADVGDLYPSRASLDFTLPVPSEILTE